MPPVEGLTPDILWYTLIGLVGLCSLVVLGDKVAEVFRKKKARDAVKNTPSDELAEHISKKITEQLEPRFADIDRKLANDKLLIEEHTRRLAEHDTDIGGVMDGQKVLCRGILALLSHEINGNSDDKLRASQTEITNFLIDK